MKTDLTEIYSRRDLFKKQLEDALCALDAACQIERVLFKDRRFSTLKMLQEDLESYIEIVFGREH